MRGRSDGRRGLRLGLVSLCTAVPLVVLSATPVIAASEPPEPTTASSVAPSPAADATATADPTATPEPEPTISPEPTASPEPRESPEPRPSPEPDAAEDPDATEGSADPREPSEPTETPSDAESPIAAPTLEPFDADSPALLSPGPEPLGALTYVDVSGVLADPTYSAFARDIAWLGRAGIADGMAVEDGRVFGAEGLLTRGELAAYLYRLAGSPSDQVPAASAFADARPGDTPYSAEIAWVASQGIELGRRDGVHRLFRPDAPVTRGALAVMLHRFAGAPASPEEAPYVDLAEGSATDDAVAWLAGTVPELGWDSEDGREFRPDETITRGAVAAVLRLLRWSHVEAASPEARTRLVAPATVVVTGGAPIPLRAGPSDASEPIAEALDGDELATTGTVRDDSWVEVLVDDELLWAAAADLALDPTTVADAPALAGDATAATAELGGAYANGRIPATALCELPWEPGVRLACGAARDLERLDAEFSERFGVHLGVTGGYRSFEAQVATKAAKGWLAATPGTSNHGWGEAIDLDENAVPGGFDGEAYSWLVTHGPTYGWHLPGWAQPGGSKPEPWHLEHIGRG